MIENFNASKTPSTGDFLDIPRYIGVASVNVVAVNPNNSKLREFGWNIPEDAPEPQYSTEVEKDGNKFKSTKVRFLVQIKDLDTKPVIALDFWCRDEIKSNKDKTKFKIVDAFNRTAWATRDEIQTRKVPVYTNGQTADIATPYSLCHFGEDDLLMFLFKYLNITPLKSYDRVKQEWVENKNPGKLTFDSWEAICNGDVSELKQYISLQPENCVKVILGVKMSEDNKTYQTFFTSSYLSNAAITDRNTGEYTSARKALDKYRENNQSAAFYKFSAQPVKLYTETPSEVKPAELNNESGLPFDSPQFFSDEVDDLPFAL